MVVLFKSFGPENLNDMITIDKLASALKEGGEVLKSEELEAIFYDLAGQTKRSRLPAEKRFDKAAGITFEDFMAMMLPK